MVAEPALTSAAPPLVEAQAAAEEEEEAVKVETPEQQCWTLLKENPRSFETWEKLLTMVVQQVCPYHTIFVHPSHEFSLFSEEGFSGHYAVTPT